MRAAFAVMVLGAALAEAKSPIARPYQGSVLARRIDRDAAGLIAKFAEGAKKAEVQPQLEAVLKGLGTGAPTVGFVKTDKGPLAAIYPSEATTVEQLLALATAVSQVSGVEAVWAYLHPGGDELALEAWWKFQKGTRVDEDLFEWREDVTYTKYLRRSVEAREWQKRKWGKYPLAELARTLGLPGRDALERPRAMLELATAPWPRDVGENLVHVYVFWADGMLLEVRQESERLKVSMSRVVEDAVRAVHAMNKLGESPKLETRAPYDSAGEQQDSLTRTKELGLFLTRETFDRLEEQDHDFSLLTADVWRIAHPYKKAKE